jgi:hypothetical protein
MYSSYKQVFLPVRNLRKLEGGRRMRQTLDLRSYWRA